MIVIYEDSKFNCNFKTIWPHTSWGKYDWILKMKIARIGLKAGLSEKKLSLMPCLRTFSNVLFSTHCVLKQNN